MNIKMKMIAMRRYMKIENMTQNIIIGDFIFRQNNLISNYREPRTSEYREFSMPHSPAPTCVISTSFSTKL